MMPQAYPGYPVATGAALGYRAGPVPGSFVRGLVSAGLLAAIQNQPGRPVMDKRALRLALQGGASLAAASMAAQAWQQRDLSRVLVAVAAGAACVAVIEKLMNTYKESTDGQEKA
ncbi:MAG: hypothetical protein ACYC5U_12335 [Rhodocyclaceae bacterium]